LDINLYELLKSNNFVGLENKLLKNICFQVLNSLNFLSKHKIIHCDLKPENILLRNLNDKDAFLIDFGGSCFENEIVYSYIQSRYYRSPEVILGKSYNNMIDMWSFGCLLAELKAGRPIFAGDSEHDQLNNIMEYLGVPPQSVLINAKKRKLFFDNKDKPLKSTNKKGKIRIPETRRIEDFIRNAEKDFYDLIKKCLVWDPRDRLTPEEALSHPWFDVYFANCI